MQKPGATPQVEFREEPWSAEGAEQIDVDRHPQSNFAPMGLDES
jgi:hypothetical protein